jgi:hypothetical protein
MGDEPLNGARVVADQKVTHGKRAIEIASACTKADVCGALGGAPDISDVPVVGCSRLRGGIDKTGELRAVIELKPA